jgi:hypothetical protein
MPSKKDSTRILEQCQVTGLQNTYVLGYNDRRVTFSTQQLRAFNLVWALFVEGVIKKKSKVAVIGGGLAGMTTSAALNSKGCKVTLYHDHDTLMDIQQESLHRYIHPNIFDWPDDSCDVSHTNFPCMNWTAGTANRVVEQIQERWEDLVTGIKVHLETHIDSVKTSNNKPRVYINKPASNEKVDCIIVAAGFGIETNYDGTRYGSYWEQENLGESTKITGVKSYLISGCGDGGLIDALRLRLKKFNHEKFSRDLLQDPELKPLKEQLLEIEKKAPSDPEDFATYILDEYKDLTLPSLLTENFKKQLRTDTEVELNGSYSTAMSPKACLINRFSLFLLMDSKTISYQQGKIGKIVRDGSKRLVDFKIGNYNMQKSFDEVVVRHGPESVVEHLFIAGGKLPDIPESKKIRHKVWEDGFYPETKEQVNQISEAAKNMEAFKRKIDRIDREATISIQNKNGVDIYVVLSDKYDLDKMIDINEFKSINVYHGPKVEFKMASGLNNSYTYSDVLTLGSSISNNKNQLATLGCFVSISEGRTAFLSSSHLFENQINNEVFFKNKELNPDPVGRLLERTTLKASTEGRRNRNIVDAALIGIATNVSFSRSFERWDNRRIAVQGIATAKIGEKVHKYGAGSGYTIGKVTATHCSIILSKDSKKYFFEEAIMVESIEDREFATSGDSGAVVFREDGKILGMIFAFSKTAAILCPIEDILRKFQCSLMIY